MKLKIEGDLSARNFSLSKESYTLVLNLSLPIDSLELSVAKDRSTGGQDHRP